MGFDLEIWSVAPVVFGPAKDAGCWRPASQGGWRREGQNWQIVLNRSAPIAPEHVPSTVEDILEGAAYLTEMNLEGEATGEALLLARDTANALAQGCGGVVVNPQKGTAEPPGKTKPRLSLLSFGWWFLENPFDESAGWENFLALLERALPEALPLRYGTCEPPEFDYRKTAREHLAGFLSAAAARREFVVWYPKHPVREVSFAFPNPAGESRAGFRTNCLFLKIEASVLNESRREEQLRRFWHDMSLFFRPLYGDVRVLNGFLPSRTTYACDAQSEKHPVQGWFWKGVPDSLGLAAVLGPQYADAWPEPSSIREGGLVFASVPEWKSGGELIKP